MTQPAVAIDNLVYRYGRQDAVDRLTLHVPPGSCYGLFGRNGAGKSTTIKCIMNHLTPNSGSIAVFGIEPRRHEVAVKARIGYVPENVAFYPWMSVQRLLDYAASFRPHWNKKLEADLLQRFNLDPGKKVNALSKGMRAQAALICAICPEPELLLLDEPTSGLDPIVRREFLETVVGSYLEGDPGHRTVLVSTHLIHEWEGLIDQFSIVDAGRTILSMDSEAARAKFRKLRLKFNGTAPETITDPGVVNVWREGAERILLVSDYSSDIPTRLQATYAPALLTEEHLSLEEIFIAVLGRQRTGQ